MLKKQCVKSSCDTIADTIFTFQICFAIWGFPCGPFKQVS